MEARTAAAALLVALLLTPAAAATWTQARGGPGRDGVANLADGPLDVVADIQLPGEGSVGQLYSARAFETSQGTLVLQGDEDGCRGILFSDIRRGAFEELRAEDCRSGRSTFPFAYDPQNETVYLCQDAPPGEAVLQARDARTLALRWSASSRDLGALEQQGTAIGWWTCMGGALDVERRQLVVPFVQYRGFYEGDYQDHRVASFDADTGDVEWSSTIPQRVVGAVEAGARTLSPQAVTLTSNGIIVTGREACPYCRVEGSFPMNAFSAWFTREGDFSGYDSAKTPDVVETGATPRERSRAGSEYAVARGPTGLVAMGGRVVLVNPEFRQIVAERPVVSVEPPTTFVIWPAPSIVADIAVVPLPHSLSGYSAATLDHLWSWGEDLDWQITDTIAASPHHILVVIASLQGSDPWLVRLDARSGRELERFPLPMDPRAGGDGSWYADLVALSDGHLLLLDGEGQIVVLGRAEEGLAPAVEVSSAYPAPGEAVTLTLPAAEGVVSYRVHWGDGVAEEAQPGSTVTHAYAERGASELRVTAFHDDGRTASTIVTMRVGEPAPPELTTLQRAFSPENQEISFFVLGTLITIIGLAVTVGRNRRRFSKLERELNAVEEIRMLSTADPRGAVLALKAYRDRLPEDLARRRIDDSQYHILDIRSARLLKVLRTRLLAPYDARLSARYHRLLDAAFEDAVLQRSERDALIEALAGEGAVRPEEKEEIARMLADFTSDRTEGGPAGRNNA